MIFLKNCFFVSKIKHVLYCCSLRIVLVHNTFTRLYILKYKFNDVVDVDTVF